MPGQTTLAAKQNKQISFVDAEAIKAKKVYEFYPNGFQTQKNPLSVESRIAFRNSSEGGLGEALPAGTVRVYTKDQQDRAQFIGESGISHIAAGSHISMKIGEAFDITVKPTKVNDTRISRLISDVEMKYEVKNAKPEPVTVYIHQSTPPWGVTWTVLEETTVSEERANGYRVWPVKVPAEGEMTLSFKIRQDRR